MLQANVRGDVEASIRRCGGRCNRGDVEAGVSEAVVCRSNVRGRRDRQGCRRVSGSLREASCKPQDVLCII